VGTAGAVASQLQHLRPHRTEHPTVGRQARRYRIELVEVATHDLERLVVLARVVCSTTSEWLTPIPSKVRPG
jgi:hypothetical protein